MKIKLLDYCPSGYGVPEYGPQILSAIRKGMKIPEPVVIDCDGMVFTGSGLLNCTIGVLVGEIGEAAVRERVQFIGISNLEDHVIDTVLVNATQYFAAQKKEKHERDK